MPRPLALALALLALPACGDPPDASDSAVPEGTATTAADAPAAPAAAAPETSGCARLTAEEASEILGVPVTGEQTNSADCAFTTPSGEVNASYSVAPTEAVYDALAQGGEAVEGMGEAAMWVPTMNVGGSLFVKKAGQTLQVVVMATTDAHDTRAHAEAMARVLEPRM